MVEEFFEEKKFEPPTEKRKYPPLPQGNTQIQNPEKKIEKKEEIKKEEKKDEKGKKEEEFKEDSNEKLKKRGSPLRVINVRACLALLALSVLIFAGVFYYLGTNRYLGGTFVDNSTCSNTCPTIPACPNCPVIPACPNPVVNVSIPTINVNCNSS